MVISFLPRPSRFHALRGALAERDIPSVFEVSSVLKTPEMEERKRQGVLIGDK